MENIQFSTSYVEELYNEVKKNGNGFAKDGHLYAKTELINKGLCKQNVLTGELCLT